MELKQQDNNITTVKYVKTMTNRNKQSSIIQIYKVKCLGHKITSRNTGLLFLSF